MVDRRDAGVVDPVGPLGLNAQIMGEEAAPRAMIDPYRRRRVMGLPARPKFRLRPGGGGR